MHLKLRENLLYVCLRTIKFFDRRDVSLASLNPAAVRTILLVSNTAFGDTVLSTGAMAAIRSRYPHARIIGYFHASLISLFSRLPSIDRSIAYLGGWQRFFRTIWELQKERIDLALILHGNEPQATATAYLGGARFIIKLPNTNRFNFLLSNRHPRLAWKELGSGFKQRMLEATLAGASPESARTALPLTAADLDSIDKLMSSLGIPRDALLVGLQTGASSRARMWPADRFVELARMLTQRHPKSRFLLTGSASERAYCAELAHRIGAQAINLAGKVELAALPALLSRCALLVTGDTGTMHAAVAVGTPVVALFAVSTPSVSGPAHDPHLHRCIHRPAPPDVRSKSDDQAWIAMISADEVLAAAEEILGRARSSPA